MSLYLKIKSFLQLNHICSDPISWNLLTIPNQHEKSYSVPYWTKTNQQVLLPPLPAQTRCQIETSRIEPKPIVLIRDCSKAPGLTLKSRAYTLIKKNEFADNIIYQYILSEENAAIFTAPAAAAATLINAW